MQDAMDDSAGARLRRPRTSHTCMCSVSVETEGRLLYILVSYRLPLNPALSGGSAWRFSIGAIPKAVTGSAGQPKRIRGPQYRELCTISCIADRVASSLI
jgi:hypothetical protein